MSDEREISAGVASLKVLESWGVKNIFGYPGGSINSLLSALQQEQREINFIQVRHEQVAALAASAHAKLTGQIGVAFGSAGPGAVNLLNGLYDAKEDHAPVLALVGQVPNTVMNYDYFQEFPETPIFRDVACYDRIVMTPESLPHVIDEAIKHAYKEKGVAVVVVPNNFGYSKIPEKHYTSYALTMKKPDPQPSATDAEVDKFLNMVKQAKRPVFHVGSGIKDHGDKLIELSKKLQIPIVIDGLAKGLVDNKYEAYLGTANRAASKAADEILSSADLVIAIGGDFVFAQTYYATHPFKYVQIDNDKAEFGKHHDIDLSIWSDSGKFIDKALERSSSSKPTAFLKSAVDDMNNWREYLKQIETSDSEVIHAPQLYNQLNKLADDDAIFSIDVGNNIIDTFRYLNLTKQNKWVISALFATMGSGLPGAIAAKLHFPEKQVFNIAGDGAQSMVIQDLVTLHKYNLPVINIVTSNKDLGFISGEQEDAPMKFFGLDLEDQDFAKIAEGMGVEATTVTKLKQLPEAIQTAIKVTKSGKPFLIDVRIVKERALPVEDLQIQVINDKLTETVNPNYRQDKPDSHHYSLEEFFDAYDGKGLKSLPTIFKENNVEL